MERKIENMTGFAEWENKKIIKLKDVTLYSIPLRYFSERSDFDKEEVGVQGTVVSGNTLLEVFSAGKKGITKAFSGFCADKIILENEDYRFTINEIEFTTPFENGRIKNVEFHGTVECVEYKNPEIIRKKRVSH